MIFEIEEAKLHCEWLMERGLGLGECAQVLINIELGDSFSLALLKAYKNREYHFDKIHERIYGNDWNSPLTP